MSDPTPDAEGEQTLKSGDRLVLNIEGDFIDNADPTQPVTYRRKVNGITVACRTVQLGVSDEADGSEADS